MQVKLLSEIPLYSATKRDLARAVNYSMKRSKEAAWNMTRALNLSGKITPVHIDKIYGNDVFTQRGQLVSTAYQGLVSSVKKTLNLHKKNNEVTLMDYALAFVKEVARNGH